MAETLEDVKAHLRNQYLGKSGIHGVGIRRSENAVCVYMNAHAGPDQETVLKDIEKQAAPFKVIVIREEPPSIT